MRKTWLAVSGVLLAVTVGGIALAQMHGSKTDKGMASTSHMGCGRGMMGTGPKSSMGHTMSSEIMPCGMTGHGMMQSYLCCPMMTTHSSVDYFLSHSEGIELSDDQVKSLESIRDSYRKERIQETANLEIAILELDNLLSDNEIDLSEANELNKRIEAIRTEVRFKEIEAFVKAKRVLNRNQFERLRSLDSSSLYQESRGGMMHK